MATADQQTEILFRCPKVFLCITNFAICNIAWNHEFFLQRFVNKENEYCKRQVKMTIGIQWNGFYGCKKETKVGNAGIVVKGQRWTKMEASRLWAQIIEQLIAQLLNKQLIDTFVDRLVIIGVNSAAVSCSLLSIVFYILCILNTTGCFCVTSLLGRFLRVEGDKTYNIVEGQS